MTTKGIGSLATLLLIALASICSNSFAASWWGDQDYVHGDMLRPIPELAQLAVAGQVLFIDTREAEEFEEGHIPYSINLRLVDIKTVSIESLKQYKYVVPYCVKDFRGYEVARALKKRGLSNVIMMSPSGLNGWKSYDFPISKKGNSGKHALEQSIAKHFKALKEVSLK